MRSLVFGIAALLAVATPSLAAAETGGWIKFTYASIEADGDDRDYDDYEDYYYDQTDADNAIALSGVVITDVSDRWRIQFNAASSDTDANFYGSEFSVGHSQVEVHATYAAGPWDVGAFTGMFNNDGHSFYEYGVEAAVNFERGEIAASVAGATSPNSDFYDDITTVHAEGTFYLTEHIALGASASQTNFGRYGYGYYYGEDAEVTSYSVHAAYSIPNTDFTVAVGYRAADSDEGGDTDFIGLSLAWSFGEGAAGRRMPGADALIPDAIATLGYDYIS